MKKTFFDEFLTITNELDSKLSNFEKLERDFIDIKRQFEKNPNSKGLEAMMSCYANQYKSFVRDVKVLRMLAQKLQEA